MGKQRDWFKQIDLDGRYILNLHICHRAHPHAVWCISAVERGWNLLRESLAKTPSFFSLLHFWNNFGQDKANENNEQVQEQIRQISRTNPAYRTTLWQHWGRRSKSPSHNFCSGGRVGIFLFKLSNKTWKIFHLFSPRQRYLWNIFNEFCFFRLDADIQKLKHDVQHWSWWVLRERISAKTKMDTESEKFQASAKERSRAGIQRAYRVRARYAIWCL